MERFGRVATREVEALTGRPRPIVEAELWSLAREWRLRPVAVLTGRCGSAPDLIPRVTIRREIPGARPLELDHLLLDVNGTIANRAQLIDGVEERIGANPRPARGPPALGRHAPQSRRDGRAPRRRGERVTNGAEKRDYAVELGPERCAAIGNGINDVPMLEAVRLGIVVVGPEGSGGPHGARGRRRVRRQYSTPSISCSRTTPPKSTLRP